MLARAARVGEVVTAEPIDCTHVQPMPDDFPTIEGLGLEELAAWLNVTEKNPLRLLVPNKHARKWRKGFHCSALSSALPTGAFLRLAKGRDDSRSIRLPTHVDVLIDSPPLSFVHLAHALGRRASKENTMAQATRLRLIEFACESCGTYVRDPFDPRNTIARYDKPGEDSRFCGLESMSRFTEQAHGLPGSALARQLLGHAVDCSGSGMETYLNLAFCGKPALGGLSMKKPLVNNKLVVDEAQKLMLKHQSIRPDMQWPWLHTLVEYLGDEEHRSKKARIEDKDRLQDYTKAGYTSFFLMFDDVKNAQALNSTAQMIAREHMRHGLSNELYRVRNLIKRPDFAERQTKLIVTLLPPLSKEA